MCEAERCECEAEMCECEAERCECEAERCKCEAERCEYEAERCECECEIERSCPVTEVLCCPKHDPCVWTHPSVVGVCVS